MKAARGFLICFLLAAGSLSAQVEYLGEGDVYSENFDGLVRSGTPTWVDNETVFGWSAYFAMTGTPSDYIAYDGTSSAGGVRSFGIHPNHDEGKSYNRSLGFVPGSQYGDGMLIVRIVNATGVVLKEATISYVGQLWRVFGEGEKALLVEYQIGDVENPENGEWIPVSELTFDALAADIAGTPYDGTLPENSKKLTATIPDLGWKSGEVLNIRFFQKNDVKNKGFAIDDFTFSATSKPAR